VVAGILDFVPNFGPLAAAAPAILVAAGQGKIVHVIALYGAVQLLEGWVIRPYVERRVVETPPALLLGAQVIMATLVGVVGLLVAPALVVLITILVKRLYIEDALGHPADGAQR
jgi:predicted PurR-regulated permease PerM